MRKHWPSNLMLSSVLLNMQVLMSVDVARNPTWPVAQEYTEEELVNIPPSFDWRDHGAVTPVKNQGLCGCCWAFSTTGNIEGQWFLAGNALPSLSEQNLVDCDHDCSEFENQQTCDAGCHGGLPWNAYNYVLHNAGIDTEASYSYTAVHGSCKFKSAHIGAKISNWTMVSTNETQIAAYLVQQGPLSVLADAAPWQYYIGGVFDLPCGTQLDHAILLVGYGTKSTMSGQSVDYWLIKNSWGDLWGEKGYIKLRRGVGKCAINTYVSTSLITK